MENVAVPPRFTVHSLLGVGEAGRVYRVFDHTRDRELALKVVPASDLEFLRLEFDTLHQVRHENIIQVFDWDTLPSGGAYYTMELVEGEDWGRRTGAPQPAQEVRRVLTGLLRGLAHLHCHGEIHGDLKPGNILLGVGGVVKVTDIGMGGGTRTRGMAGTPGYTAPECWEGKKPDIRSDLYSVGVMAYEALTGTHPFAGRTIRDVVAGQMEGWVPPPGAHGVRVPADLERMLMRALERAATLRHGSADEFMTGLGVEDRIGVILGGKFVDPSALLPAITPLVHRKQPDEPTLICIAGAPGSGKTELAEQVDLAYTRAGVRSIRVVSGGSLTFLQALGMALGSHWDQSSAPGLAESIAGAAWDAALSRPLAILLDGANERLRSDASEAKALAQHLFAMSLEQAKAIPAVVVLTESSESDPEVYSVSVHINELDEAGTLLLAEGLLGRVEIPPGAVSALHRVTGGNPSALQAVLFDLMTKGDLDRIEGCWKLAEVGRLGDGASPTLEMRWRRRWQGLNPAQRDLLGSVALTSGIERDHVAELDTLIGSPGTVAGLQSSGWLKSAGHRITLASEGLRSIVLEGFAEESLRQIAIRLLDSGLVSKDPAIIAIRLRARPSSKAVSEAVKRAATAMSCRDVPQALALLTECARQETHVETLHDRAAIHINLAEVLVEAGDIGAAERSLRNKSVTEIASREPSVRATIHLLLGTIAARTARVSDARQELERAMNDARTSGDLSVYLRSLAAYAELSWTHGNDQERNTAIGLVENALLEATTFQVHQEERGQLIYGLGAAHIRTGHIERAVGILEEELPRIQSSYWGARTANALGSACFYLGHYDKALGYLGRGLELLQDGDAPEIRARIHANRGACFTAMGQFRTALDENQRALILSRRSGSGYDTVAAAAGIAVDHYYLARYDEAIAISREVAGLASRISNVVYEFKGLELEGFATLAIGDLDGVGRIFERIGRLPQNYDPVRTLPRVEILRAKYWMAMGDRDAATAALQRGRDLLGSEPDLDDLWWIEIELASLKQVEAGVGPTLATLTSIAQRASEAKILVIETQAAVAIAQILLHHGKSGTNPIDLLTTILGRAEEAGFMDNAWRINIGLGVALIESGDIRAGQTRLIQAQRLLVQIADGLSPESRRFFVRSPHVAPALEEIAKRISSGSTA